MGLWTIEFFWGVIPWFLFFGAFAYMLRSLLKDKEKAKIWILQHHSDFEKLDEIINNTQIQNN